MDHALADCNSARKRRARENGSQYFGYNCLLSRYSSSSEEDVRLKERQIDDVMEKLLKRCAQTAVIDSGWWRECKDFSSLTFGENAIGMGEREPSGKMNSSENIVRDLSAEHEVKRLHLFGSNYSVNVYYMFSNYKPSSRDSTAIERNVAQLAGRNAWIATVVTL